MEISGTISNGQVVLDDPCALPDGTKVTVHVAEASKEPTTGPQPPLGKRLLKHAGTVEGLPQDLAEQPDHYLYGTPKR